MNILSILLSIVYFMVMFLECRIVLPKTESWTGMKEWVRDFLIVIVNSLIAIALINTISIEKQFKFAINLSLIHMLIMNCLYKSTRKISNY